MLVLVVDTATPAITAALARVDAQGVTVLAERVTVDARAHGELLAPQVHAVLNEGGAGPEALRAIVAGVGPGPFTGLRVGLVTAAALGQALSIPLYGVCSLDGIGLPAAGGTAAGGTAAGGTAAGAGRVLVATDARRKEVYWAVYERGRRITEPAVTRPAAVDPHGAEAAVGDGALRYAAELGLPVREEPRYPSPAALARVAADRVRAGAPGELAVPLYLRRPDAVEPGFDGSRSAAKVAAGPGAVLRKSVLP